MILQIVGDTLIALGVILFALSILRKKGFERTLAIRETLKLLRFVLIYGVLIGVAYGLSVTFGYFNVKVAWYITAGIIAFELIFDWSTTVLLMKSKLGIKESNPIHVFLMRYIGFVGDFAFLIIFISLILVFVWRSASPNIQIAVCVAYLLVYVNNGYVLRRRLIEKDRAERYVLLCRETGLCEVGDNLGDERVIKGVSYGR